MTNIELTDSELVRSVLEGDHPAFTKVVEKYYDRLYAIAYGHLLDHEEAADLVQDVFIRAYEKLDTLRQWDRLGPFLARIAKNFSLNKLKSKKRFRAAKDRMEYRLTVDEQSAAQELSEAERNDLHAVLRVLVKTLPASSREVVLLHYFEEMSTPEIADFLGVRQPAVLQRLHYGRKLLRTRMEHELKPALENDEQRRKHIHAIMAAIPFGTAPWAGNSVPVRPIPAAQSRRLAAVKVGAAGSGLIAAAGLLAWWFALATLNQPNPPVQDIAPNSVGAAIETTSAAPNFSESAAVPPAPDTSRTTTAAFTPEQPHNGVTTDTAAMELVFGPPPWQMAAAQRSALQTLISMYNSQNPGVTVRLAPDHAKLNPYHIKPEHVGDIILDETIGAGGSAVLARLRELDAVIALDSRMAGADVNIDDYYPNVRDLVVADGHVWGLPFFTVAWAFALPSQLEEEPWVAQYLQSWEQFPDLLSALWLDESDDGRGRASVAMLNPLVMWNCLFLDAGGNLNDIATLRADSVPATTSMARFRDFFALNQPAFQPRGTTFSNVYSAPDDCFRVITDLLPDEHSLESVRDLDPAVTLLGAPGSDPIPSVFSHVLAIKTSTPAREQAAWDFVQWLTSDELLEMLYRDQGILPLRESLSHIVTSPDGKLLLAQIKRMQFQRPQRDCIAAYETLRNGFGESLKRHYERYLNDEIAAVGR